VNIIEGAAHRAGEDRYTVHWADGQAPLMAASDKAFSPAQNAFLAIRPEKVLVTAERPADAVNAIQGRIHDIAYLGNISTYHVEVAGGRMLKAQTANTRRIENRGFTWENRVWLSWDSTAGVLLER